MLHCVLKGLRGNHGAEQRDICMLEFEKLQRASCSPPHRPISHISPPVPPTDVAITSPEEALSVGEPALLECLSGGAAPPALLTWLLDGRELTDDRLFNVQDTVGWCASLSVWIWQGFYAFTISYARDSVNKARS